MKKTLTIIFTALSFLIILDTLNAPQAIAMFLLAGIIPGTDMRISATQMLNVYTFLTGFVFARLAVNGSRVATTMLREEEAQSSNGTILSAQS